MPALGVFAQTIDNPIGSTSFCAIIDAFATFALQIVTPISVIVILYAGTRFMFSGGDVEKIKKAKRALTWAVVGLAVVLTGRGVIFIVQEVLGGGSAGGC